MSNEFNFNGKNGSNKYENMKIQELFKLLSDPSSLSEKDIKEIFLETFRREEVADYIIADADGNKLNLQELREKLGDDQTAEIFSKLIKLTGGKGKSITATTSDIRKALKAVQDGTATSEQEVLAKTIGESYLERFAKKDCDDDEEKSFNNCDHDCANCHKHSADDPSFHNSSSLMTHICLVIADRISEDEGNKGKFPIKDILLPIIQLLSAHFTVTEGSGFTGLSTHDAINKTEDVTSFLLTVLKTWVDKETKEDGNNEGIIESIILSLLVCAASLASGSLDKIGQYEEMAITDVDRVAKEAGITELELTKTLKDKRKEIEGDIKEKVVNALLEGIMKDKKESKSKKDIVEPKKKKDIRDELMDD